MYVLDGRHFTAKSVLIG